MQVIQPSLRAAIDFPVKLLGTLAVFFMPFIIESIFLSDGKLAIAALLTAGVLTNFVWVLAILAWPVVQLAFTRYDVDEDGIRIRMQIFSKSEQRVSWEKVTSLYTRRGIVDRVLGIEKLDVVAYGEKGTTFHLIGLRRQQANWLRNEASRRMREAATVESLFHND